MANTILNPSIIAKAAVKILDNELNAASKVYRAYEEEFSKNVNGYKIGSTLTIRKPAAFTVTDGPVISSYQDATEGTTTITVNRQKTIPIKFTSQELTLNIGELSERVIKPIMVQFANQIDLDVLDQYKNIYNWVGTPGSTVNGYASFGRVAQRMSEMAVPADQRCAFLSPADFQGGVSNLTGLYIQSAANSAYREGRLGMVAGLDTYEAQNVRTLTTGLRGGTPLINGANQNVSYTGAQANTYTQSLITDGWSINITGVVKAGDVFTIANVFAVNPVTKAPLPYLQQFVVTADANSSGAGAATLTISPAIITSGPFQTVSGAPADNAALTFLGSANTAYAQNLAFHKNAFALCCVPLEMPQGVTGGARESYKGISVRVQPFYDGTNDATAWRFDLLYGVSTIDPRLAVRFSQ